MKKYFIVALKGCAMGMADVIPGVSGGTIAFISGIYDELIGSIRQVGGGALPLLLHGELRAFWQQVHGNFLLSVFGGILLAIFSLAKGMTYLLAHYPIEVWSFFFGLIVASALMVCGEIKRWNLLTGVMLLVGVALSAWITMASPAQTPETWWFILLSGAIAICAMILPGISGAFILLLLGKYQFILQAVATLQVGVLLLFAVGAIAGLTSFSHLLGWLLAHYRNATVALLTGFMLGSLNKVWPWKEVIEVYADSHGVTHPLVEQNVLPQTFAINSGNDAALGAAVVCCAAGFLLILGIEWLGHKMSKTNN
jgi:putative membrane protein